MADIAGVSRSPIKDTLISELLSINHMATTDGQKIWLVLKRSRQNIARFIDIASRQVTKAGIAGNVEEGKDPCPAFHLPKAFFFSPKWLIKNGIGFHLIIQEFNDIVITDTYGFHEVVNPTANVTLARNLCIDVRS